MQDDASETVVLRAQHDITRVRRALTLLLTRASAKPTEMTKFVTAASELARNTVLHGGGGTATIELTRERKGFRISTIFEDAGPGIADVEAALRSGFTTGSGLGLGLGGAKRLCEVFELVSSAEAGTRVRISSSIGRR